MKIIAVFLIVSVALCSTIKVGPLANRAYKSYQTISGSDTTSGPLATRTWVAANYGGPGGGETNTASNLGGGLANYSTKVGVDLQFNSFASADFDLGSNLITVDATKWAQLASPTFTGTVTIPSPFTLGTTSVTADGTELNYVDGVTSAIQTQLNAKVPTTRSISTSDGITGGSTLAGDLTLKGDSTSFIATDYDLQIRNCMKRFCYVYANVALATATTVGMAAPTLTATAASNPQTSRHYISHTTTTTSGNPSGVISANFNQTQRQWLPEFCTRIRTGSDISSIRIWIGLLSASADASATPNIHAAAFRYDTGADGTAFWRTATIAGTGGSGTYTATSQSIAINTEYQMRIVCGASDVKFYINGTLVNTHSATLPTASTNLGYGVRVVTLTTAARVLNWSNIVLIQK